MADQTTVVIAKDTPIPGTADSVKTATSVRVRDRENGTVLVCVDPSLAVGADKRTVKGSLKDAAAIALQVLAQMEQERKAMAAAALPPKTVEILAQFRGLGDQLMLEAQEEVADSGVKQAEVDKLKSFWAQMQPIMTEIDRVGELDVEPQTEADLSFWQKIGYFFFDPTQVR